MKSVSLNNNLHLFAKTNLVTIIKNKAAYDEYTCERCGLSGKRYGIDDKVFVNDSCTDLQLHNCNSETDTYIGKTIKIINCEAMGSSFANCTPDSIHRVIKPIEGHFNGDRGVWVQGKGEPVKILFSEFIFKAKMKRTTKPKK